MGQKIEVFIFDLDGVISQTERQHKIAWKDSFNQKFRDFFPNSLGKIPFDEEYDYHQFIDGKSREDGIKSYLSHRINSASIYVNEATYDKIVQEISEFKTAKFLNILSEYGVDTYEDALLLIKHLKAKGYRLAVASSSKNAKTILERTGLTKNFDFIVSGIDVAQHGLNSKPKPDIFLYTMELMGVSADQACIIEDSLSGVQAAIASGCPNVIAILRGASEEQIKLLKPKHVVRSLDPSKEDFTK